MNLNKLSDIYVFGKRVIVRMDLDVDEDYTRVDLAKDTILFLIEKKARVIISGHKGRPEGKIVEELSLRHLAVVVSKIIGNNVAFVNDTIGEIAKSASLALKDGEVMLLENLRFDQREEKNSEEFAKNLASLGEVYINEAFAVSHRKHASIIGIPKLLPHAAGSRFIKEVDNLSRIIENPKKPLVAVISGTKEDKVDFIKGFVKVADKILVGGIIPNYFGNHNPDPKKIVMGRLTPDTFDIDEETISKFKEEISRAGTLVLAGVPGKYEEEAHRQGTKEVFEAIARSPSFKLAGGGDAEAAITLLGLNDRFDWISVGGGAMLEFLSKGTLPGIEALLE